jgi:UDPglucose 6-dehydrogenase
MRRSMAQQIIFDGRNQYEPDYIRSEGFEYFGVGRLL